MKIEDAASQAVQADSANEGSSRADASPAENAAPQNDSDLGSSVSTTRAKSSDSADKADAHGTTTEKKPKTVRRTTTRTPRAKTTRATAAATSDDTSTMDSISAESATSSDADTQKSIAASTPVVDVAPVAVPAVIVTEAPQAQAIESAPHPTPVDVSIPQTTQPAVAEERNETPAPSNREERPAPVRDFRAQNNRDSAPREMPVRGERALRFRGRDGRAEIRTRDGRNEGRSDNRNEGRGDNRGFRNRQDGRGGQPGGRDNNRNNRGDNRVENEHRVLEREYNENRRNSNDYDLTTLEAMEIDALLAIAEDLGVHEPANYSKADLTLKLLEAQAAQAGNLFKKGILEILPDGKGFLRTEGYLSSNEDVYISQSQIKRFNLKTGDIVSGPVRAPKEMERFYGLLRVEACNGEAPDINKARKEFEKLTPIFPDEKFALETTQENTTARIIDLVSPIGKGQRGLIVAPPKAGKTSLIKNVANSIMANHPDVHLIVLLIDERPEEVTDIARSVRGEVVASTFDEMPENHIRVADMVLEKAKRMVEQKRDVVILLDSITRLSRASNLVVAPSGRTMSGGLDPAAMYKPKRLFGAARNIEEGGSLTILATVLVDTGSRMDEYIFEELKGTGNMDLVLDRNLFDQRIFPAIDINKSGTRRDDLLLSKEDLAAVYHLRRTLSALDNDKAINLLIDRLRNTKTNADFMEIVRKSSRAQAAQNGQSTPVS